MLRILRPFFEFPGPLNRLQFGSDPAQPHRNVRRHGAMGFPGRNEKLRMQCPATKIQGFCEHRFQWRFRGDGVAQAGIRATSCAIAPDLRRRSDSSESKL
jgi:hypothetical protein